jgi:hypothetical protein
VNKVKAHLSFIVFFIIWLTTISFLWKYSFFLTLLLLAISILYFVFLKKANEYYYFIVAAITGPIGEAIVSKSGLWTYAGDTVLGIPYWLPLAWGITAVAIKRYLDSLSS